MGRTATIKNLLSSGTFSISIGAGRTRLAEINVDISSSKGVDVVCSATALPFCSGIFHDVFFTDVIEHLPKGTEQCALWEIHRVLGDGRILLTTPNSRLLFTLLDPAWWLQGHRHYSVAQIEEMVKLVSLNVECSGTFGSAMESLRMLLMYLMYPIKRITGFYPELFSKNDNSVDRIRQDSSGLTLFVIASK